MNFAGGVTRSPLLRFSNERIQTNQMKLTDDKGNSIEFIRTHENKIIVRLHLLRLRERKVIGVYYPNEKVFWTVRNKAAHYHMNMKGYGVCNDALNYIYTELGLSYMIMTINGVDYTIPASELMSYRNRKLFKRADGFEYQVYYLDSFVKQYRRKYEDLNTGN